MRRQKRPREERIRVLLMEVDYQLMCLFDAMQADDKKGKYNAKRTLQILHYRLDNLGHFKWTSEAEGI